MPPRPVYRDPELVVSVRQVVKQVGAQKETRTQEELYRGHVSCKQRNPQRLGLAQTHARQKASKNRML